MNGGFSLRAIIRFNITPDINGLRELLEELNWIPKGEDDEQDQHKADILDDVAIDKPHVERTFKFMVLEPDTSTWGLVSNPAGTSINVRLKNHDADLLRKASLKLVSDLDKITSPGRRPKPKYRIKFSGRIDVLAPHSTNLAFFGNITDGHPWQATRRERKPEFAILVLAVVVGLSLLLVTSPPSPFRAGSDYAGTWLQGNLDRLTSAAIFSALTAGLQVVLRYFELRRSPIIDWV
jgi:hypothetical protein